MKYANNLSKKGVICLSRNDTSHWPVTGIHTYIIFCKTVQEMGGFRQCINVNCSENMEAATILLYNYSRHWFTLQKHYMQEAKDISCQNTRQVTWIDLHLYIFLCCTCWLDKTIEIPSCAQLMCWPFVVCQGNLPLIESSQRLLLIG